MSRYSLEAFQECVGYYFQYGLCDSEVDVPQYNHDKKNSIHEEDVYVQTYIFVEAKNKVRDRYNGIFLYTCCGWCCCFPFEP